jgi:hypothetical protein
VSDESAHVDSRRMLWLAPLTIAVSVLAVLAVREVAIRVVHPAPGFAPLTLAPPVIDTILGCLGAILVFAMIVFSRTQCVPTVGLLPRFFSCRLSRTFFWQLLTTWAVAGLRLCF